MSEDLITIGMAVDTQPMDKLDKSLNQATDSAGKTDKAINKLIDQSIKLGNESRGTAGAVDEVAERVRKLKASVDPLFAAQDRLNKELAEAKTLYEASALAAGDYAKVHETLAGKLTKVETLQQKAAKGAKVHAHEMLNLSRQASDVGVSLAMGMNPLMVLIQQGPQIADVLAMTSARGVGVKTVFKEIAAAVWAALAPFAPFIAAAAAAAAVIGGGFLLATRNINKEHKDFVKTMGLTADQMERVKHKTVTVGDTFKATFQVIGKHIFAAIGGPTISKWVSEALDNVTKFAVDATKALVGGFTGAAAAIGATWKLIPAAIADATITAANYGLRQITLFMNSMIDKINGFLSTTNGLLEKVGVKGIFGQIQHVAEAQLGNPFAGKLEGFGEAALTAYTKGAKRGAAGVDAFFGEISAQALKNAKDAARKEAGKAPKTRDKKGPKTDEEKEYDRITNAARSYVDTLAKETAEIGLNDYERKQAISNIELEQLAKARTLATTDKERAKVDELVASVKANTAAYIERAKAEQLNKLNEALDNENAKLTLQAQLINATNKERAIALARLTAEQELTKQHIDLQSAGAQAYIDKAKANAAAQADLDAGVGSTLVKLERVAALSASFSDSVKSAASGLADAFGSVGKTVGDLVSTYADLIAKQDEYNVKLEQARLDYGTDSAEYKKLTKDKVAAERKATGDMISITKGFFKEKSAGYKFVEGVERAYRLFEFAMEAKSIAIKIANAATHVALEGTKATASGIAAYAITLASLPFPFNLAAGATVLAALAAVGVALSGGSKSAGANLPTAQQRQDAQGTGSVFGDDKAKSASIANSLALAEKYQNSDLEFSNSMAKSLKSIDNKMGYLAAAVVRAGAVGGPLDTSGLGLGKSGKPATLMNLGFGSTTTKTLNDQGLEFGSQSLADILARGITGQSYQELITNTKKKAFGITYSNKTSTSTVNNPLGDDLEKQLTDTVKGLAAGVLEAAKSLGLEGAQAVLDSFNVNLGKLSFKDMSGQEIQDALTAIFGKLGDDMAKAVGGGLVEKFQKVGEGGLETLVRLATGVKLFDQVMTTLGKTLNLTGTKAIEAKQSLIDLMGGLDNFNDLTKSYIDTYLTDAEQLVPVQAAVSKEMARLGLSAITTKDGFKQLVAGIDLSTTQGQELYAALMAVAPAFAKVADAAEASAKQALADAKQLEADKLKVMQDAQQTLIDSYTREATAMKTVIDKFKTFSTQLRQFAANLKTGQFAQLSPSDAYAAAKSLFETTRAKALGGDENAIKDLQAVSEAYLNASKDYYATSAGYFADLDAVQQAINQVADFADAQANTAQAQLDALNNLMDGIDGVIDGVVKLGDKVLTLNAGIYTVNASVVSVADAITNFKAALGEWQAAQSAAVALAQSQAAAAAAAAAAQSQAIQDALNRVNTPAPVTPAPDPVTTATDANRGPDWNSYLASNPDVAAEANRLLAVADRNSPWFAQHGLDQGAAGFAQWHYDNYGQAEGRKPYAAGGIIDRPMTLGEAGIGGEAGPEAVMPLRRVGNGLGVRAAADPDTKATLEQIRDELKKANNQRGAAAIETLSKLGELVEGQDNLKRTIDRK